MPFHFRAVGTIAELEAEMASPVTSPDDAVNQDFRAAAFNFVQQAWDEATYAVPNTMLNNSLVLDMHGHYDESGFRLQVTAQVARPVGSDLSTSIPPNPTEGGATS